MGKKGLLLLIMVTLAAGGVFAQSDFASMAKNTVTVDVGPTIAGFAIGKAVDIIGEEGITGSGFGIGGQYERQLSRPLSVAARLAYMKADLGIAVTESYVGGSGSLKTDLSLASFSAEGHVRFYPLGDTFFLDGMVGYAQLKTDFSGSAIIQVTGGSSHTQNITPFTVAQNYIKLGAKVGWRFCFGRNGGFTFEPAFGYSYGIGLGDPIKDQFTKKLGGDAPDVDEAFKYLEKYVFIGGPRVSLAFGYRF